MVYNGLLAFTHCIFDQLFESCNEAVCGAMPAGKYFSIPMRHHWLQLLLRLMTSASDASVEASRGGKMWNKVVPPR